MDMLVPYTQDAKQALAELAELFLAGRLPDVLVVNKPREEPVTRCMLEALGEPPSSVMSLPLLIGNQLCTFDDQQSVEIETSNHILLLSLLKSFT